MILTAEERDHFARYLEYQVHGNALLLLQMGRVPGSEPMVKKMRTETMAMKIVAGILRSAETMSVEGEGEGQ